MTTSNHILYILMRSDLDSLNAGKAIAQGAHAAQVASILLRGNQNFNEWSSDLGFGTTVTLGATGAQIDQLIEMAKKFVEDPACVSKVVDPTYPLRDGAVTHTFPLMTCAYVFGTKEQLASVLGPLNLY